VNPEDPRSLEERIANEIGACLASDLGAHVKRGAVVVVDTELSLLEVAVAVASDNAPVVEGWIAAERMKNPTPAQIAAWESSPATPLRSVIVRPYVLVQELGDKQD
jgi:hypothetical protein